MSDGEDSSDDDDRGGGGGGRSVESAAVGQLVELGFEAGACRRALAACGGDVEAAAEALQGGGGGGGDMSGSPGPGALDALIARSGAANRLRRTGDAAGALVEYEAMSTPPPSEGIPPATTTPMGLQPLSSSGRRTQPVASPGGEAGAPPEPAPGFNAGAVVQLCGMVNHQEVNGVCAVVQQRGYDEKLGHYYKLLLNGRAKPIKIKAANVSAVDKSLLRWTTYVDSEGDRTQIRLATSGKCLEKRVNFDGARLKVVTKLKLVEKDSSSWRRTDSSGGCQTLYWDVRDQDGYGGRIALRGQDAPAILNRLKTLKKAAFGSEAAHRGKSDPHSEPQHRSALQALPPAELPNGGVPMKGWSEESAAGWVTAVLKVPNDAPTTAQDRHSKTDLGERTRRTAGHTVCCR
eukprot:COSAG01_NODE_13774_length_1537_cov_2.315021_1_plen_405_part_00